MIISFEGIDQSGKATQAELLRRHFESSGVPVKKVSFPRYTETCGELIASYLRGDLELSPVSAQLLYELDRYMAQDELRYNGVTILDRYQLSGLVYAAAHGLPLQWCLTLQEFQVHADITFLLDISPEVSFQRKLDGRDRYEQDIDFLTEVRKIYLSIAQGWPGIVIIDASRSIEEIAEEIVSKANYPWGLL